MTRLLILLAALCAIAYGCPPIVSRSAWGSRWTNCKDSLKPQRPLAIIHHTEGASCSSRASCISQVKNIQNFHINDRRWCDIGYNFLIGGDGSVYEGRGWTKLGAHAKGSNSISIGIAFIGSFQNKLPPQAAINAAKSLIQCGVSKNYIRKNYTLKGHRNVFPTDCPGNTLYNNIRTWGRFKEKGFLP
ncbi:peptidoglycan-recognition protein SC2-like [Pseudophryne corroboree]|uniref:peptidoglycan-recognition protein SC2-like n=1 Tax=Pseudophryne corroboree TaxID=495146 RepID=UPI003081F641